MGKVFINLGMSLAGTTFYFVNDGIESALRQAREAAGAKISTSPVAHMSCSNI